MTASGCRTGRALARQAVVHRLVLPDGRHVEVLRAPGRQEVPVVGDVATVVGSCAR
ncbi:hypothetical protein [Thalassiella azotivora]